MQTAFLEPDFLLVGEVGGDRGVGDAQVFDVYTGAGVPEGSKSLAVEVTITPTDKTLTEPEIEALSAKIIAAAQKAGATYSGVKGIAMQDASLQESMGPIVDRTKENLVSTDNGIIMARHRLRKAALALQEKGVPPPGVDPAHHRVRSAAVVLPPDQAFKDAWKEELKVRPGVAPASV